MTATARAPHRLEWVADHVRAGTTTTELAAAWGIGRRQLRHYLEHHHRTDLLDGLAANDDQKRDNR